MTGWIAARTKEPGSLSLRGSNVDGAHPGQGAQKEKSELGDNEFDFSAFECEVTRRHPAQREAQDWRTRFRFVLSPHMSNDTKMIKYQIENC